MDQCSAARHPISATGTLTNRPGRDLALEVDHRFSYQRRSPTGGSVNSVPRTQEQRPKARCSIPISLKGDERGLYGPVPAASQPPTDSCARYFLP